MFNNSKITKILCFSKRTLGTRGKFMKTVLLYILELKGLNIQFNLFLCGILIRRDWQGWGREETEED